MEVENILLTMDNVKDASVYGERHPLTGNILAARINLHEPEPFDAFKRRLEVLSREVAELQDSGSHRGHRP